MLGFLFLVPSGSTLLAQTTGTVRVKGLVKDTQGREVAYATLVFEPGQISGLSNESGRFEVVLPPGSYTVQVAHLGYRPRRLTWDLAAGTDPVVEGPQIVLEPRVVALQEITVQAGKEDPAYRMMRQAIAAAPTHAAGPWRYTAETYVKGQFKIIEVPWILRKQMEKEGLKMGVTYVMESASRIKYSRPKKFEEKVLSRRSNLPASMEANLNYSNINLYEPQSRDWVSPLSPKSFAHYRFEYLGSEEEDGERLHRIAVKPRGQQVNRYKGILVLRSQDWSLDRVELSVKNPAGDLFRIGKQFRRVQGFSMQTMENLQMELAFLGASAHIRYVSSIRRFDEVLDSPNKKITSNKPSQSALPRQTERPSSRSSKRPSSRPSMRPSSRQTKPAAEILSDTGFVPKDQAMDAEYLFEVDSAADSSPDSLWETLRTLRLDSAEIQGYAIAQNVKTKEAAADSADSTRSPWLRWAKVVLLGTQTQNGKDLVGQSWTRSDWSGLWTPRWSALDLFNPLEGWVVSGTYRWESRDIANRYTEWKTSLRWGTRLHRMLPAVEWTRRTQDARWHLEAGSALEPLSGVELPRWVHTLAIGSGLPIQGIPWWYSGWEGVLTTRLAADGEQRLAKKWRMWYGASAETRSYVLQNPDLSQAPLWSTALVGLGLPERIYRVYPQGSFHDLFRDHHRLLVRAAWRWEPLTERRKVNGWVRYRRSAEAFVAMEWNAAWLQHGQKLEPWYRVNVMAERNKDLGADRRWHGRAELGWFPRSPGTFADFYAWPSQAYTWGKDRALAPRGLNPHLLTAQKSWWALMQEYQTARLTLTHWKPLARMRANETLCAYVLGEPGRMLYAELTWKITGIAGLIGLELGHQTSLFRRDAQELMPWVAGGPYPRMEGPWWLLQGRLVRISLALP
ncbi:MAG: DUF5686 family protein [Bacteroidia bacterium]